MKSDWKVLGRCAAIMAAALACSVCLAQGQPQPPSAKEEPKEEKPAAYVPPLRGAVSQVRRVGGATRGWGDVELPLTVAIAPDHTGLTASSAPTLYWFLSHSIASPVVLTVIEDEAIAPLIERQIGAGTPGLHRFSLREHGISLKPDTEYEWSVAIVLDPLDRSRDVVAQGNLRIADNAPALVGRLQNMTGTDLGAALMGHGLFYDAFDALAEEIGRSPEQRPRALRRALLEQIGLPEVAAAVTATGLR
jgi:hypothetical protein